MARRVSGIINGGRFLTRNSAGHVGAVNFSRHLLDFFQKTIDKSILMWYNL